MIVRLEHPISLADGSAIRAITIRAPTLADVEAINPDWLRLKPGEDPGETFDVGMDLFERLTELPREAFQEMDGADYLQLCDLVAEQLFKLREQYEQETDKC